MGRPKGSFNKAKDKFANLPEGFKKAVESLSTDEIRKRISEVTLACLSMREILKQDEAVLSAKEVLANLMEPYRADFKSFGEQLKFCKQILEDKGGGLKVARNDTVFQIMEPGLSAVK